MCEPHKNIELPCFWSLGKSLMLVSAVSPDLISYFIKEKTVIEKNQE